MQPRNEPSTPIDFGEPLDLELLLNFAEVTASDMESAIQWWDDNASPDWVGALENTPKR